ncbi:MAG TPA: hypothetical protein VEI26_03920 [Terriglobales bacterium]|nr:hypothetical protein [Terriglobales bacterium]
MSDQVSSILPPARQSDERIQQTFIEYVLRWLAAFDRARASGPNKREKS